MPAVLNDPCAGHVVTMLAVFISSYKHVQNPYLVGKLVEVAYVFNPAVQPNTKSLSDQLLHHPLTVDHFVPALMQFYTGALSSVCTMYNKSVLC